MKKIAILGSTGSIGTQTLDVVRANGDIEVLGISAGRNVKMLEEQAREFHPQLIAVWDENAAKGPGSPSCGYGCKKLCLVWRDFWSLRVCPRQTFWLPLLWE